MPRSPRAARSNPLAAWSQLALRQTEMLIAAQQVIAHRTTRMLAAGPSPSARDRREFSRMVSEKGEAAWLSAFGMGAQWWKFNQRAMQDVMQAWVTLPLRAAPPSLLSTRRSASNAAALSHAMLHAGLKPIHAKATANAKRLGRSRKRSA